MNGFSLFQEKKVATPWSLLDIFKFTVIVLLKKKREREAYLMENDKIYILIPFNVDLSQRMLRFNRSLWVVCPHTLMRSLSITFLWLLLQPVGFLFPAFLNYPSSHEGDIIWAVFIEMHTMCIQVCIVSCLLYLSHTKWRWRSKLEEEASGGLLTLIAERTDGGFLWTVILYMLSAVH